MRCKKGIIPNENFYYDARGLHFVYNRNDLPCISSQYIDVCVDWPRPNPENLSSFKEFRDFYEDEGNYQNDTDN